MLNPEQTPSSRIHSKPDRNQSKLTVCNHEYRIIDDNQWSVMYILKNKEYKSKFIFTFRFEDGSQSIFRN